MVHLAIDGMWQVFKLQRSTLRNDFCRIAAKNGILLRLINTLYSLNEATRLALISGGGGFSMDGLATRSRSGPLDPTSNTFVHSENSTNGFDYPDHHKVKHAVTDHQFTTGPHESSRLSSSQSPDSRFFALDTDKHQSNNTNTNAEAPVTSRSPDSTSMDREKTDSSQDAEPRQRLSNFGRLSTDRPRKSTDVASNGYHATQQENVRPLLSLLDKEPPSRHYSGQLEYVRHLTGLEKHESILPLLHSSNEKKTNGMDFLMAEFAEASSLGRVNANTEATNRTTHNKLVNKKVASNEGGASTSGIASQTASGVLSGSGVLNARPGSATSSGLLSHMVSPWNADVAREYLEKVADLLLEFAGADSTVKSYMCIQSLLSRLFQMFNKIEPPILLKLLKCINHLSTDPHCLEHIQRADAIKHLIPNLDLKDGPLVSQIHHELGNLISALATKQLPYPSNSFEMVHCSRCRVDWHENDGILLKEVNRLFRPNGYFVYSAPPAYRKDKDFPLIWEKLVNITSAMCWRLIAKKVQTAIWIKDVSQSCLQNNADQMLVEICDSVDDKKPSWKTPLRNCVPSTAASEFPKLPPRPHRQSVYLESLNDIGITQEMFLSDSLYWQDQVHHYWRLMNTDETSIRNVMDMNALNGGFVVAFSTWPLCECCY